ncbi:MULTISPECIES: hypothetical protein [unclassified Agrococcus]|uniref:hypothetical protein n=1 Tax=unclassified Agrococcus TaxID=2615065 RepID=UPI00361CCAF5
MSDARPHDEASEVEALTEQDEVQEGASPDAQHDAAETVVESDGGDDADREADLGAGAPEEPTADETGGGSSTGADASDASEDASASEPGAGATDDTGQDVEDAGTGTADTTDDPQLDSPD